MYGSRNEFLVLWQRKNWGDTIGRTKIMHFVKTWPINSQKSDRFLNLLPIHLILNFCFTGLISILIDMTTNQIFMMVTN